VKSEQLCVQKKKEGTKMSAPQIIIKLVERFEQNKADYRAGKYNETQLRREFLDPFFEALGWDVDNRVVPK